MAEEQKRERGPSEYAKKDAAARRKAPAVQTSCLFKLIGIVLVGVAGYLGYFAWGHWNRTGKLPDFTDANTQKDVLTQGEKDFQASKQASREVLAKLEMTLADLQKRIKGKPPETKEEVSALVKESQAEAPIEYAKKSAADSTESTSPPEAIKTGVVEPDLTGPLALALAEYRKGQDAYVHTDPLSASQEQVQKYIHIAAPHFEECLKLIDEARRKGANNPKLDELEQKAAKRLIDCRRRIEMNVR